MAQYSALMVTKKEYHQNKINQYIKKRLDNYLKGRAMGTEKEVPLALTNFETTYLHYEKGMVVMNATYNTLPGGKFLVKLKFAAHKFRADEIGNEKEIEIGDYITFGVFDADNEPLYLKKHWVNTKTGELEFVVDRLPARAGIDPYYFLVDKNPGDNIVNISRNPSH